MADVDWSRGERLLQSARDLLAQGDLAGVAGLAYQAFESALIALTQEINGADPGGHVARRDRAKQLLAEHRDKIDRLWEARNIDFYGNPGLHQPKRELTRAEAEKALDAVTQIFAAAKQMLADQESKSDE